MNPFVTLENANLIFQHLLDTAQTDRERDLIRALGSLYVVTHEVLVRTSDPYDVHQEKVRRHGASYKTTYAPVESDHHRTRTHDIPDPRFS